MIPQIARSMGPTWGSPGSCRPQMDPMLAPWTLLSGTMPRSLRSSLVMVCNTPSSFPAHRKILHMSLEKKWDHNFVIFVPADGLAPYGTIPVAGMVLNTEFAMIFFQNILAFNGLHLSLYNFHCVYTSINHAIDGMQLCQYYCLGEGRRLCFHVCWFVTCQNLHFGKYVGLFVCLSVQMGDHT